MVFLRINPEDRLDIRRDLCYYLVTKVKEAKVEFAAVRKLREIGKLSDEVEVDAITFRETGS